MFLTGAFELQKAKIYGISIPTAVQLCICRLKMMKAEKYFNGSNAEFLERYNAFSGKNLSARILKRMMNKWKYDLNDNHIYFKSYKENNIRKVEVKYDCENDNSDSEYVRYDKYDENIAV